MSDETFAVWVGCLGCYNEGRLIGAWFNASEAPEDMDAFNKETSHQVIDRAGEHEELWCFDSENEPVSGEMSPMDARRYAELIEDLSIPLGALKAWLSNNHETLTEESIQSAVDAHAGDEEDCIWDSIAGGCDIEELPGWATSHYDAIINRMVEDARMGGEWYEYQGYYFWAH
ncbi:antirestriction protein ArdA [Glutamicibacter arilaitensis]|uniref:antirestriction protein ArdA n=1 Tax=Glutamicibacter arilaitensis TaxID=256701 RepID=UPI003F92333A